MGPCQCPCHRRAACTCACATRATGFAERAYRGAASAACVEYMAARGRVAPQAKREREGERILDLLDLRLTTGSARGC
jgi:hypothetical protein